jgi:hypothetical protein
MVLMYKVRIEDRYRDSYPADFSNMTELHSIEEIRRFRNIEKKELEMCEKLSKNKSIIGFSRQRYFDRNRPRFCQVYVEMVNMYETMLYNHEREQDRQTVRIHPLYGGFTVNADTIRGGEVREVRSGRGNEDFAREYFSNFAPVTGTIRLDRDSVENEAFENAISSIRATPVSINPFNR